MPAPVSTPSQSTVVAKDAPAWLRQAQTMLAAEDWTGAVTACHRAVQLSPDWDEAHATCALALTLQGAARRAKREALAALGLNPANSLALKVLARVQLDWGNPDLARAHCEAILARDPTDADALTMREQCREEELVLPLPVPAAGPGFDAYISLGNNCEAGLQFRRIGYEESSFFRFTTNSCRSVIDLIRHDFSGVYERDQLQPHADDMVWDSRSGVGFHSELRSVLDPASGARHFLTGYDFDEVYGRKDRPKVRHLVAKWRALTSSRQNVLYILKLNDADRRAQAMELRELFRAKYPPHRCTILCLQTVDPAEPNWAIPGVINRYFPRFAPLENVHEADTAAWDRIFQEFPLNARPDRSARTPQMVMPIIEPTLCHES